MIEELEGKLTEVGVMLAENEAEIVRLEEKLHRLDVVQTALGVLAMVIMLGLSIAAILNTGAKGKERVPFYITALAGIALSIRCFL